MDTFQSPHAKIKRFGLRDLPARQTGYVIELDLGVEAMLVASNPSIDATYGCLAIQHGPFVYCHENRDQAIQGRLPDVEIDKNQPLSANWDPYLLDGVMVIDADGRFIEFEAWKGRLYLQADNPVQTISRPARLVLSRTMPGKNGKLAQCGCGFRQNR